MSVRSVFALKTSRVLVALSLSVCSSCVPPPNDLASGFADAGFWTGVWHGIGSLVFLVLSFFGETGIYAAHNTGFGYNAGFLLGVVVTIGVIGVIGEVLAADDHQAQGCGFLGLPVLALALIALVGVVQCVILMLALAAA